MGFYEKRVLPRILNTAGGMKGLEPLRRRVCEGLSGDLVEIGFGSGLNIPFYPTAVTRVAAVEPADLGWKLAGKRVMATSVHVERSGLDGQSLPFQDDSFDAALSSWTLCTIPDVDAALLAVDDRGVHHQRTRRLLREGRPEVRRRRLPRHRPVRLGRPSSTACNAQRDPTEKVGSLCCAELRRGHIRPGGRSQPAGPWGPA